MLWLDQFDRTNALQGGNCTMQSNPTYGDVLLSKFAASFTEYTTTRGIDTNDVHLSRYYTWLVHASYNSITSSI